MQSIDTDLAHRSRFSSSLASPALDSPSISAPTSVGDGQPARLSALSTKITTILSSSYANIEIRDALEALDARNLQNTAATRRNIRLDLQNEIIGSNGEIIRDFGEVAERLRSVGNALTNLQNTVAEMRKHVTAAKLETAPMIDEANSLLEKQEQVKTKKQILDAFNTHFLLSDNELLILTSTAEPVNDDFFLALVKVKKIHRDCQVLLGGEHQRLGLEILEQSSKHLNAAFQKLFRWVQREFRALDLENPQIAVSVRRAVRVLAERRTLFQSCLDTFAEARQRTLSDAFYAALTGSTGGRGREMQKPIEFSAHEPLRYVGDMLAWVHSTAVSEREALEGLFISDASEIARGIGEGLESEPWARTEEEEQEPFDGRKALGRLIDRGLFGAAQHLRNRVDQVVQSHDEPVLTYKVSNLIAFYRNIFARLVESADFIATLDQMQSTALAQFQTAMRVRLASISTEAFAPEDLSPPHFLVDALDELRALLTSYETSAAAASASDEALHVVLDEALTPFTTLCVGIGGTLGMPASTVFVINCLQTARSALMPFRMFATTAIETIESTVAANAASLGDWMRLFFLQRSGLLELISELDNLNQIENTDAALQALLASQAFSPNSLHEAAQRLDAFLPSAVIDANEQITMLKDKNMESEIVDRAAEGFRVEFEELVEWLEKADIMREDQSRLERADGGEDGNVKEAVEDAVSLREIFPRTVEEVGILLS